MSVPCYPGCSLTPTVGYNPHQGAASSGYSTQEEEICPTWQYWRERGRRQWGVWWWWGGWRLTVTGEASGPPPIDSFQPIFQKGLDDLVLATKNELKNEQVAKSFLDDITLAEDLKLYKSLLMTKMMARQDQVFKEVKNLAEHFSPIVKFCNYLT